MKRRPLSLSAAGIVFIIIGIASAIYSTIPVNVSLAGTVKSGQTDVLTPEMNINNSATIVVEGSYFDITVTDPSNDQILSRKNISSIEYNFNAKVTGEYKISVKNVGNSELQIGGNAQTNGSAVAFIAQMLLVVTGIFILGLSLKLRNRRY